MRGIILAGALLATTSGAVTITVTNNGDSGPGTLRQALADISTSAAPRVVAFNLTPTGAVHTIAINTPLLLAADTLVDGTTQPLFSNPPPVRVVASPSFSGFAGLWALTSTNTMVRGLYLAGFTNSAAVDFAQPGCALEQCWVISNFYGVTMVDVTGCRVGGPASSNRCYIGWNNYAVHLQGYACHDNLVAGNAIGAVPVGGLAVAAPNAIGVLLVAGAHSNIVRGSTNALQLISGNSAAGVDVEANTWGNRIEGNQIGTDPTGLGALPNQVGIQVFGSNTVIGGGAASNRNVIAGNSQYGVQLNAGSHDTRIAGNYIGVTFAGTAAVTGQVAGVLGMFSGFNEIAGSPAAPQIIAGNAQYGIRLLYDTGTVIRGNSIGIGAGGAAVSNGTGVSLGICLDAVVGGTNAADGNVIAGNNLVGAAIQYCRGVRVEGNLVGMEPTGLPRPTGTGIDVLDSTNVVIGGSTTNARNYIAGTFLGVAIGNAGSTNVQVLGNHIGLTPAGALLTNGSSGISVAGPYSTIGGSNGAAERNVISGSPAGIFLTGGQAHHTVVVGNYIGTDPAGVASRSNSNYGVWVYQAPSNRIGGRSASERNVISGNAGYGIAVMNSNAVDNEILGNYIGTTASGLSPLGNGLATNYTTGAGVLVQAPRNRVGGTAGGERNVISGNRIGVSMNQDDAHDNRVEGNFIGVDASGMGALGNQADGVYLSVYAYSNAIGGIAAGAGNVISGNAGAGVHLVGGSNNVVQGNTIGPALDQLAGFTNQDNGIIVEAARNIVIGGTNTAARNLISGHGFYGVEVLSFSSGTRVEGNWIGLNGTGSAALSNLAAGVLLSNSSGSNVVRGNVISGNGEGVALLTTNCPGDWVAGNWIGTDWTGALPVRNKGNGVSLENGIGLRIGGAALADRNLIAFNGSNGIAVTRTISSWGVQNALLGNLIYSNAAPAIDLGGDGATANDASPDGDAGVNGLQNYPVVTNAVQGLTLVQGAFVSAPSQSYQLEFYAAPSGGQARVFLGGTNLLLGGAGTGTFTFVLGGTAPTGWVVAASATDTNGNTSELSPYSAAARIKAAVDSDGDGLWDVWEQANFGGSLTNNGSGDNDGDGVNNYAEFIADTSPTNAASYFDFVLLTNALPHYPVWPTSAARFYDLEGSTNLAAPAWVGIASNLPGTGVAMSHPDAADATSRVYRARVKLP